MSWLKEAFGGPPPAAFKEKPDELTQKDPAIPNRFVSNKSANRPFLAYAEHRERQKALHEEWLQKKKERDEKIARGEKVGPLPPDPTEVKEVGVLGILKFLAFTLLFAALAGKFITGSYTWEYESRWMQLKSWLPRNERLFSPEYLAQFNGEDPSKPIYLSIEGDVFDVTQGGAYQPGGSYNILAGKEGARAFGTGCFKEHMTHDTRGLDPEEKAGIEHWKKFYAEHKTYWKVGRLMLPPIDPKSPIPEHCDPKKRAAQAEKEEQRKKAAAKLAKLREKQAAEERHGQEL